MADASAKRVEIVMRYSTVVTVYALLSATPAFAAGGGAIAWDRETGKYGASWNQPTPKRAAEAAICRGRSYQSYSATETPYPAVATCPTARPSSQ